MLGSLNEFIGNEHKDPSFAFTQKETSQEDLIQVQKLSRKKIMQDRRKSRIRFSEYIASDKKYYHPSSHNSYYKPKIKQNVLPEQNYITGRKPISQSRISSMFHNTSAPKEKEEIGSENLKRQHNLLRAIVRTKMSQHQNVRVSEYEQSFQRMVENLGNVRIKPVLQKSQLMEEEQNKTFRSLQISKQKKKKLMLSHRKRIQFQNCLNWSKKHRKNGSFYAQKLGKNIQVEDKNIQVEKRKQMLETIHKRSSSVSFSQII